MAVGRPTLYKPEYTELALNYCLLGATDADLANYFKVDERTINRWKIDHPEFCQSLKEGREEADSKVAKSLYKRACGYSIDTVKVFQFQGEPVIVPVTEEVAPDTGAAMAWLKNRQPKLWRDKRDVELSGSVVLFSGDDELED